VEALEAIFARRSVGRLSEPAPSTEHLDTILRAAATAPDHQSLRPLRLIVLAGPAKDRFGDVLAGAYEDRCAGEGTEPVPAKLAKERTKLGRAPVVVVVAATDTTGGKLPFVEQVCTAAAAAENALIAATALGYGSMWRTGEPAYDGRVKAALGLGAADAVAGFLYLGTADPAARSAPRRPDLTGLVTHWST